MANEVSGVADTGVVRLLKIHEPRLDIRADREMVAVMGASSISTRQYISDSASTSSVIWSQTTPSVRVGVDRMVELDITFDVELKPTRDENGVDVRMFPGVGPDDVFRVTPEDMKIAGGARQYPLHSVIENCQVRLNDQAFNWEPSDTVHALLNYGNVWEDRQYNTGSSAHKPDNFWRYEGQGGGSRSPFTSYNNGTLEDSRSGSLWFTRDETNELKFQVRCIEQLMLAPFTWGEQCQALFGIQNIDVNLTFRRPLERIFSGDFYSQLLLRGDQTSLRPGDKLNMNIDLNQTLCKLHITYLQPQANQIVPMRLNYPFYTVRRFVQDNRNLVLPGGELGGGGKVNFNNITLHECPKRAYIFARPKLPQRGELLNGKPGFAFNHGTTDAVRQADFFATITGVSFNWDSQDGRLSTLDAYDLWRMSVNNGYKRSFLQWQKYLGSVLCLEFGKDLALSPLVAPGVRGNFQLSFEIKFKDIRTLDNTEDPLVEDEFEAKEYNVYLLIVPTGILTIENQLVSISVGSITEEQVLTAPFGDAGTRAEYKGMYGGARWSSIWSGIKKGAKFAKPILGPIAAMTGSVLSSSSDPRAQVAGQVLKAMSGSGRRGGSKQVRCSSLARRM